MSLNSLFKQTITLYSQASYDRYGREQVGSGVGHKARVQPVSKIRLLPNGETARVDAIVYLKSGVSISTDDRVDFDGTSYKVFGVTKAIDGMGNTNHQKVELIKWQTT